MPVTHNIADSLRQNLRYACRRLIQSPGFACTAILSLALGIGANTAIFSLVNAVLLREPPYKSPDELVEIYESNPDFPFTPFSYPTYEDYRNWTRDAFSDVLGSRLVLLQADRGGRVETTAGEVVTGNYFKALGIPASLGRTLLPEDDTARGAHPVVMLGYGYWQRAFGGDPGIVGRQIRLGGRPYTIVGVAARDYVGTLRGLSVSIIAPMTMINELQPADQDELKNRGNHSTMVKARLKPGITMARAQAAAAAVAARLKETHVRNWDPNASFKLVPARSVIVYPAFDPFVRAAAWLLMIVVGLVLLVACTNLASFLLAKGMDRRKEIAIRLSLGATRRSLAGQLLTETLVLGFLGGVAGVGLAAGMLRILLTADLPTPVPITLNVGLDATVLAFSLAVSLGAGLILGLAPALQSTRPDVVSTLRDESAGGGQRGKVALRNALVVAQVAVSLVLLVGAGLFLRSYQNVQSVDPGFGRRPTAILTMFVPSSRYTQDQGRVFVRKLLDRFRQLPGVESVGLIANLHLNTLSTSNTSINVDGVEPPPGREFHVVDTTVVDPGFFDAAGIRVLSGRTFTEQDVPGSPPVAVINQAMANRFWPGGDPLGHLIRRPQAEPLMVVGVVSNAKIRSLGEDPRPFLYRPYGQNYQSFFFVLARTSIDPGRTALDMLAAGRELDPDLWTWEAKTMDQHLGTVMLPARLSSMILTVFAAVALALVIIGLYGIVSYAVSRRTREVGIRMSLGADRGQMVRMLMASGVKVVAVGSIIGLVLALGASRLVGTLLFKVSASDLLTFVLVPVLLVTAAVLAAYIPARRASRVDPAAALRTE